MDGIVPDKVMQSMNENVPVKVLIEIDQVVLNIQGASPLLKEKALFYLDELSTRMKKNKAFLNLQKFALEALLSKWADNFDLEKEVSALKLIGCVPPIESLAKIRQGKLDKKK